MRTLARGFARALQSAKFRLPRFQLQQRFNLRGRHIAYGAGVGALAATLPPVPSKDYKSAQNQAIQLIKTMHDNHPPPVDPAHSNHGVHQSGVLKKPRQYADNELRALFMAFEPAIDWDRAEANDAKDPHRVKGWKRMVDLEKAQLAAFGQELNSTGVDFQKLFNGEKQVPFLTFAYSLIIAEALTMAYEIENVEVGRSPRYSTIKTKRYQAAGLAKDNIERFSEFIFSLCDRNKNNALEKDEIQAFIGASRVLGTLPGDLFEKSDKQVVSDLYKRWDLDENGLFDRTEFLILNKSFNYDHCFAASAVSYDEKRDIYTNVNFAGPEAEMESYYEGGLIA